MLPFISSLSTLSSPSKTPDQGQWVSAPRASLSEAKLTSPLACAGSSSSATCSACTSLVPEHCPQPDSARHRWLGQDISNHSPTNDHTKDCVGLAELSQGKRSFFFSLKISRNYTDLI